MSLSWSAVAPRTVQPDALEIILQAWLLAEGARLLTDWSGRLLWANPAAAEILADSACLALRDGVFTTRPGTSGPNLSEVLGQAETKPSNHVFCAADGRPDVVATVRTLTADGQTSWAITLRRVADRPQIAWPDLHRAFGITFAEQNVLLAMVQGETAEAIASHSKLSLDTVRTHIRHIYVKLSVGSREALFSRLINMMVWNG